MTIISNAIQQNGFAFVRGHRPDATSHDALSGFGKIDIVEGLNAIQSLKPLEQGNTVPNTYSGNFGLGEFPLHTDLAHWAVPPRYLALRCIRGVETVGTRLLDGQTIIKHFGLDILRMTLVQPRRPMRNGKQIMQLLERVGNSSELRLRWDFIYLKPATDISSEIIGDLSSFIGNAAPLEFFLLEKGDTLIIDNWRVLHGRAHASHAIERHIDRAYLGSIV